MGGGQPPDRPRPRPPLLPKPAAGPRPPVAPRPVPRPEPVTHPDADIPAIAGFPVPSADFALDIGAVLSRTFSAWIANLVPFTVLGLIVLGPVYLCQFMVNRLGEHSGRPDVVRTLAVLLMAYVAKLILSGGIPFGVFEHMSGRDQPVPDILVAAFRRLLPVFLTAFLASLAVSAGLMFFCLPALVISAALYVAVPVTVIEEAGPLTALQRSITLSKGNVLRLVLLSIVMFVGTGMVEFVCGLALGLVFGGTAGTLAANLLLVPVQSLDGIARAVAYHDLRQGREHSSLDDLLKVFD